MGGGEAVSEVAEEWIYNCFGGFGYQAASVRGTEMRVHRVFDHSLLNMTGYVCSIGMMQSHLLVEAVAQPARFSPVIDDRNRIWWR